MYSQRSCERLVILATSREGLGIEGERLVPVPPLAVPGADADLTAITQAEAVRAVRRTRGRGQARVRGDRRERGSGRRRRPAAGWDSAGDRTRGGADSCDDPSRTG